MLTGDFNGDGIQDIIAIDESFNGNEALQKEYAQFFFGRDQYYERIEFDAVRVEFGDGSEDQVAVPLADWDFVTELADIGYGQRWDGTAFGQYSVKGGPEYLYEHLYAEFETVTNPIGIDGIAIEYEFEGEVVSEVYEDYGPEDYYDYFYVYRTVYFWYDGDTWVEGDVNGIAGTFTPPEGHADDAFIGTIENDVLNGNNGSHEFYGLAGDDVIDARRGDDTVFGGIGDDIINGGKGDDVLHGDAGDDTFLISDGNNAFYGGRGTDTLDLSAFNPQRGLKVSLNSGQVEDIYGKNAEFFEMTVGGIENVIGSRGDDRIQGKDGVSHVLDGHSGDDRLFGADQVDRLIDGSGVDAMRGMGGADTFVFVADAQRDTIHDFEIGVDQIDITEWGVSDGADLIFDAHTKKSGRVTVSFEDETLLIKTQDLAADTSVDDFIF